MSGQKTMRGPVAVAVLTLLVAMASIQGGASLAKRLFPVFGAQGTTALRLLFASLLLLAFWRPWRQRLTRKQGLAVLV
jgi:inner membrane transporter RhtA